MRTPPIRESARGIRIPRLNWTLHGYYAYYYQPPPLDSLAGPSLEFAVAQGFGFIPLHGERDIQHDIGLYIPFRGWSLDVDHFHTSARNFLDHDVIGNSGIFIPLIDLGAIISGTEVTHTLAASLPCGDVARGVFQSDRTGNGTGHRRLTGRRSEPEIFSSTTISATRSHPSSR